MNYFVMVFFLQFLVYNCESNKDKIAKPKIMEILGWFAFNIINTNNKTT